MSYAERGLFSAKLWMKCRNAERVVCLACGRYRSDEGAAVWPQMRFTLCFFIFNLNSNFQSSGSRFTKTDDKSVNHDCLLKIGCWDFDFRIENSTSLLSFVCCILKLNNKNSTTLLSFYYQFKNLTDVFRQYPADDGVDKMIPAAERTIFTIVMCCLPIVKMRCTIPCSIWTAKKLVREFPPGGRQ